MTENKCVYNINPDTDPYIGCGNEVKWEVGFSEMFNYECSGDNEFQRIFCDEHLIELCGCGNVVEFRKIGEEKWMDFSDYDHPSTLKKMIK